VFTEFSVAMTHWNDMMQNLRGFCTQLVPQPAIREQHYGLRMEWRTQSGGLFVVTLYKPDKDNRDFDLVLQDVGAPKPIVSQACAAALLNCTFRDFALPWLYQRGVVVVPPPDLTLDTPLEDSSYC
jgi:hypothetical protein